MRFADTLGSGHIATVSAGSPAVTAPDDVGEGTHCFEVSYAGRVQQLDPKGLGHPALHSEESDVVRPAQRVVEHERTARADGQFARTVAGLRRAMMQYSTTAHELIAAGPFRHGRYLDTLFMRVGRRLEVLALKPPGTAACTAFCHVTGHRGRVALSHDDVDLWLTFEPSGRSVRHIVEADGKDDLFAHSPKLGSMAESEVPYLEDGHSAHLVG